MTDPDRAEPCVHWIRRGDGKPVTATELLAAVKPLGVGVTSVSKYRIAFESGAEAWRIGPSWLLGRIEDLRRVYAAADGLTDPSGVLTLISPGVDQWSVAL